METESLGKVFESLQKIEESMVTKNEMNRFFETFEILSNPETMDQILESENDISAGRVKKINSVRDI